MTMRLLSGWRNQPQAGLGMPAYCILTTALFLVSAAGTAGNAAGGTGTVGTNQAPVIFNFTASHSVGNFWTFSGQVSDDQSVAGLVVTLGGLPSLQGVTATVNAQGWFSVTVQLGSNESGTATAQTTDAGGQASNIAWTVVN